MCTIASPEGFFRPVRNVKALACEVYQRARQQIFASFVTGEILITVYADWQPGTLCVLKQRFPVDEGDTLGTSLTQTLKETLFLNSRALRLAHFLGEWQIIVLLATYSAR